MHKTKVAFLRDYRGAATSEHFYLAGMVAALAEDQAAAVVAEGAAVPAPAGARVDAPVPDAPSDAERRRARDRRFWQGAERGRWK